MLFAYTFWIPTGRWDEQAILGPFGEDSDLRRWGLKLAARGGKNAKKRAVAAVARKVAVLPSAGVTAEIYEPLPNSQKAMRAVA
jgi:transposase